MASYTHPTALVESKEVGEGTHVWAFTHILNGARIGSNCNIGDHCFIESGAQIGSNVTVKNGNMVWEGVVIEDGVFVGPAVSFTNDLYPRSARLPEAGARAQKANWLVSTTIRHGASLGAGAVIIAGVTVGEFATVGAGAVVTRNVPSYALVVGNPARVKGWVCQCGMPLRFKGERGICVECKRSYRRSGEELEKAE